MRSTRAGLDDDSPGVGVLIVRRGELTVRPTSDILEILIGEDTSFRFFSASHSVALLGWALGPVQDRSNSAAISFSGCNELIYQEFR